MLSVAGSMKKEENGSDAGAAGRGSDAPFGRAPLPLLRRSILLDALGASFEGVENFTAESLRSCEEKMT